jgi:2-oxoglutarate dehydrogenase E2 component (dihydrolipoamide succinyltransferase)
VQLRKQYSSNEDFSGSDRFYSPLVKNIAKKEGISFEELEQLEGSGKDGRVTKNDILGYVDNRGEAPKLQLQKDKVLIRKSWNRW